MEQSIFSSVKEQVMEMLVKKLPENLFYHSPRHTLDVVMSAERIAKSEGFSINDTLLVKTAALFHDTGYVLDMREHEKNSCIIAHQLLSAHSVSTEEIEKICAIIMATKIPQAPTNKLEAVMCDADLDYLGRSDYFKIAQELYREFKAFGKINNDLEWNALQVYFLQSHNYFTKTCVETNDLKKKENLNVIIKSMT